MRLGDRIDPEDLECLVLPISDEEMAFLDRLNGDGEIHPELLTKDDDLQERIRINPGLLWKALNVKKHFGPSSDDTA